MTSFAAGDNEQNSQGVHHEPGLRPGEGGERVVGGGGPVQVGSGDGDLRPRRQDRGAEEGANAAGRGGPAEDARPPQQEAERTEGHRGATAQPQAAVPGHDREEGKTRVAGLWMGARSAEEKKTEPENEGPNVRAVENSFKK